MPSRGFFHEKRLKCRVESAKWLGDRRRDFSAARASKVARSELWRVPTCYQARSGVQKKELQKSVDACQRRSQSPLLVLPSSSGIPSPRNPVRTFGSKTSGTYVELSMSDADSSTERI